LQAKQSIPHTTVTFYGDCVKMCDDFEPNFGDKITGCYITTMYRLAFPLSLENSDQKQHDCHPQPNLLAWFRPLLLFSVSLIKDKTERRPFWYNWGEQGRIAGGVKHPHRIQLPGWI
jgi:hypothetical protein